MTIFSTVVLPLLLASLVVLLHGIVGKAMVYTTAGTAHQVHWIIGGLATAATGAYLGWTDGEGSQLRVALALGVSGLGCSVYGVLRRAWGPRRDDGDPNGLRPLELAMLVTCIGGMGLLKVNAGLGCFVMLGSVLIAGRSLWVRVTAETRVAERLRRLVDPEAVGDDQAIELPSTDVSGEQINGRWNDCAVRVELDGNGGRAWIALAGWPRAVAVSPGPSSDQTTGDVEFDQELALEGAPQDWRPLLTHRVRKRLIQLLVEWAARLTPGEQTLHLKVHRSLLYQIVERVRLATELGQDLARLTADRRGLGERLLELAASEPQAQVRLGHYRLLLECGEQLHSVLEQAAADSDAEVRAWAAEQSPPGGGPFR